VAFELVGIGLGVRIYLVVGEEHDKHQRYRVRFMGSTYNRFCIGYRCVCHQSFWAENRKLG
jgi:hypothetical protein